MTTYFKSTYTAPNPKVPGSPGFTTALYVGPNPPQLQAGQVIGKPVVYSTATGCATLSMTNADGSAGTYQAQMTPQTAQSLGTELAYVNVSGYGLVGFYTGGVIASNFNLNWPAGPLALLNKAPNSANFAKAFINQVNFWIANPFPKGGKAIDKVNGYTMVQLGTLAVMAVACPPLDWVFGAAAIAIILAPDSDADWRGNTTVIGPYNGGGLTPAIISPDGGNWGDDSDWQLFDDLGGLGNLDSGYAQNTWDNDGGWGL